VASSNNANLIIGAIHYSERHGLNFQRDILLSGTAFYFVKSSEKVLRVLRRHVSELSIIKPDSIDLFSLPLDHFTIEAFLISIDPDRYFLPFLADFHCKSSNLVRLARILTSLQLTSRVVLDFIVPKIGIQLKPKRLAASLRVLRVTLSAANVPSDVFWRVFPLIASEDSRVHAELGPLLLLLFGSAQLNDPLIDAIEKVSQESVRFIPFHGVLALALVYTDVHVKVLNKVSLSAVLLQPVPSLMRKALAVLGHLLKGGIAGWELFQSLSATFFDVAHKFYHCPPIDADIDGILALLIRRRDRQLELDTFLTPISRLVFSCNPFHPLYDQRVAFIASLNPLLAYPNVLYEGFVATVTKTEVSPLSIKLQFAKWVLAREPVEKQRTEHILTFVSYAFAFLLQWPSDDNLALLIEAISLPLFDVESAFTRIWKLTMLIFPMMKILVLLHWFSKRISPEQIASCKQILEIISESFDEKWRVQALDFVLDRNPFAAVELVLRME
jgi:hypothetical protein